MRAASSVGQSSQQLTCTAQCSHGTTGLEQVQQTLVSSSSGRLSSWAGPGHGSEVEQLAVRCETTQTFLLADTVAMVGLNLFCKISFLITSL